MFESKTLKLAAAYNLLWGAFIIIWPSTIFSWAGLQQPLYLGLWQCIGMIVGVYGIGYLIASYDYKTHWPIVLVGFLGKVFGPIGFLWALADGQFNLAFGTVIIFNDLIWWIPFAWLLMDALKAHAIVTDIPNQPRWQELSLPDGTKLPLASRTRNLLFVLVRHEGCTFCREAISQLSKFSYGILETGFTPVLVHMSDSESSESIRKTYSLGKMTIISDPDRKFYQAFSLQRGNWWQLFGPRIWWRGFLAGILKGHGVGRLVGDGFQLGGVFSLVDEKLTPVHISKDAADVENWPKILNNIEANKRFADSLATN